MILEKIKNLRLNMCGAHSTGKSTLAFALSEAIAKKYGVEIPLLLDLTRSIPKAERGKAEGQYKILMKHLEAWLKADSYICDRSIYDVLAYSIQAKCWSIKELGRIIELGQLKPFIPDLLIYVPIEFPMEEDPHRPDYGEQGRIELDNLFQIYKASHPGSVLSVTGTVDQRVSQVMRYIETAN